LKLSKELQYIFINLLFGIGYGISLHAIASELYQKGGYSEILSIQGEYIGLFLIIFSWILYNFVIMRYIKWD
jgi:hypothetical protein